MHVIILSKLGTSLEIKVSINKLSTRGGQGLVLDLDQLKTTELPLETNQLERGTARAHFQCQPSSASSGRESSILIILVV